MAVVLSTLLQDVQLTLSSQALWLFTESGTNTRRTCWTAVLKEQLIPLPAIHVTFQCKMILPTLNFRRNFMLSDIEAISPP